jgi:hypothetical protein
MSEEAFFIDHPLDPKSGNHRSVAGTSNTGKLVERGPFAQP